MKRAGIMYRLRGDTPDAAVGSEMKMEGRHDRAG